MRPQSGLRGERNSTIVVQRNGGTAAPAVPNSLATQNAEIAAQWHPTKNGNLTPDLLTPFSNRKVWWRCPKGPDHEWQASPNNRSKSPACPFCVNKRLSVTNALVTRHPEIAAQWHPTKNGELTPDKIVFGSAKKVWWKCPEGHDHEWEASLDSRTRKRGTNCPFCAGLRLSVTNSLATLHPDLAAKWHPTKNGALTPDKIVATSTKKVWWKCPGGPDHEWQAALCSRTGKRKLGCPYCSNQKVSRTNSLAALYPDLAAQWHPTKNGTLTPDKIVPGSNKHVWWQCPNGPDHEWKAMPSSITRASASGCPYCCNQRVSRTRSLAYLYPDVAAQWHPTKNGTLTPDEIVPGSHIRVWWKCSRGPDHEWQALPYTRTVKGFGCPYCAGQRLSVTNSLAALYPDIAAQWHPTRNGDVTPDGILAGSGTKVWWKCAEGPDHEWTTSVGHRTGLNKTGCPCCEGLKLSVTNSLASRFPDVAAQWHPTLNGEVTPDRVVYGTAKSYWWVCPNGPDHVWKAIVENRTLKHSGCPCCSGRKASVTNSLGSLHPELVSEWHPIRNVKLTPDSVPAGSHRIIWWKCPHGPDHEWAASLASRTGAHGVGCPFCANRMPSVTNSIAACFPHLATEWHPTKNGELTPDRIVAGSNKRVWWKCPRGPDHEWKAMPNSRTGDKKAGCPFCAGLRASVTNSLASLYPEIAVEWHPTRNGSLTPDNVTYGSKKNVWWQCHIDPTHQWRATPNARTYMESACPYCSPCPRSRREVLLAIELSAFVDFDIEQHKVTVSGKLLDVDILVSPLHLIVEYDGSYWHKDKRDVDLAKTQRLWDAGWKVIRVREAPLERLTPNDVLVTQRGDKAMVDAVLQKVESVCGITLPKLTEYLRRRRTVGHKRAKAFIKELLRRTRQGRVMGNTEGVHQDKGR